jgi:hypothetical protein
MKPMRHTRPIHASLVLLLLLGALLLPAASPPALAQTTALSVELFATDDARIQGGSPDVGFGSGFIWTGTPNGHLALVQFDLLNLPANATIVTAELRLSFQGTYTGTANVEVGRNTSAWDEATVTWVTSPTNTFNGNIRPVGDTPGDIVWPVTPLVTAWHSGAIPNFGFALRGDGTLKAFHSKETGCVPAEDVDCEPPRLAPRLVVGYTTPPEEGPRPDLGDAPDSTNNVGVSPNTAYVGVPGNFPTVWSGTPAGQPAGPRHANVTGEGILGNYLSRENEADGGPDADGTNNILNGGADNANRDRGDDGWRDRNASFDHCLPTRLTVRVRKAQAAALDRMFLNVWFDGNRDGDWGDRQLCTPPGEELGVPAHEWIVQDYFVDMASIPAGGFVDISIDTEVVLNLAPALPHWMRFTLSEQRVPKGANGYADGRGPHPSIDPDSYAFGETEDIFQRPQPPGEDGVLELEKRAVLNSNPVDYLDPISYEIVLRHRGGSQPIQARIRDELPNQGWGSGGMIYSVPYGPVSVSATGGVTPLQTNLEILPPQGPNPPRFIVTWQGTLPPDTAVRLTIPTRTYLACPTGDSLRSITNLAQARPRGGDVISATANVNLDCPGYDLELIPVDWTDSLTDLLSLGDFGGLSLGASIQNNHPFTVTLGMFQEQQSSADGPQTSTIEPLDIDEITLGPGERRELDVTLRMEQEFTDELALPANFVLTNTLAFCILPGEGAACPDRQQAPQLWGASEPISITLRPSDLGDAPDSTNHAAAPMAAYPGVPASFPTVFDPATGLPEGPLHARPRPFHLGQQVSREAEADIGPDQDPANNILPAANTPNLDRFDDGINPNAWALSHCQATSVPVRVFISPQAVNAFAAQDAPAYLNVWLDGNRDGDWADGVACGGGPDGGGPPAVEHIVIDQPVNVVALGAGLHTLSAPTGRVPWPQALAEQPSWVRVTLSERPSNKTLQFGGVSYGDGRGYAQPFRTGETEDYLAFPEGTAGGAPDLAVGLKGRLSPGTGGATGGERLTFRLDYTNEGARPATGATLVFSVPQQLRGIEPTLLRAPGIAQAGIQRNADTISFSLPRLDPAETGAIVVGWAGLDQAGGYEAGVEALLGGDSDPSDNRATVSVAGSEVGPQVALRGGEGTSWGFADSTCRTTVDLAGLGTPGERAELLLDGKPSASALIESEGIFYATLPNLAPGLHTIQAAPEGGVGTAIVSPRDAASGLPTGKIVVDPTLPVDPLSLTFTDSQGRSFHPSTLGWSLGASNPISLLKPGETYEVTIDSCVDDPNQRVSLSIIGVLIGLLRADDGSFSGSFTYNPTAREGLMQTSAAPRLLVTTGDAQRSFDLAIGPATPGIARNALDGAPLDGLSLSLLSAAGRAWPADALGQPNPQTTGADGAYSFSAPAELLRIEARRTGFQPYRSLPLTPTGGLLARDIALTPELAGTPDLTIYVSENGFTPALASVAPGSLIEWVNLDLEEHSASGPGWDSGALVPGERFRLRLDRAGSYSYADGGNPAATALIEVQGGGIFLPLVAR